MAGARQAVRALGKSDPIDALAVARAVLREPDLPTAGHDQASWEVKLLVDHREHLVAERTRTINGLRWHLHQLDPNLEHAARRLPGPSLDQIAAWLAGTPWLVQVTICQELTAAIAALTARIDRLTCELRQRVAQLAPQLLSLPGCGVLTAAKLIAETAGVARFVLRPALLCPPGWRPSRSARGGPTATGCVVVATGSSTPQSTALPSPSFACPAKARPTTGYRRRRARVTAPVMPSAPLSDASLELSTSSSSSPRSASKSQLPPLDRGTT
jgi:transposase